MSNLIRGRGTIISPDPRPLGTYEIKIAVCAGKPSILTILPKIGDCDQSGGEGAVRVELAKWRFFSIAFLLLTDASCSQVFLRV